MIYTPTDITFRPGSNNIFNTKIIFNHGTHQHLHVLLDELISDKNLILMDNTFVSNTNDVLLLHIFNNNNTNIIIPANMFFAEVISVNNITDKYITLQDYNDSIQNLQTPDCILCMGEGTLAIKTYSDINFNGRVTQSTFIQTINLVNFNPMLQADNYSLEIIGYIYPLYTETYTFYVTSNDKVRFWVNNEILLYDWDVLTDTEQTTTTILLTANTYYPIYIQQAEITGEHILLVKWESPTQLKEVIPTEKLYSDNKDGPFINQPQFADSIKLFNSTTTTKQITELNINTTGELQFNYNGTDTGFISTTGNNTLMNFTGQHRSFTANDSINTTPGDYIGLIVSTTGTLKNLNNISNTVDDAIPTVDLSTSDNDKKVFGVISGRESESVDRTFQIGIYSTKFTKNIGDERLLINSVGEGMVWISDKGGNLTNGDLITTSTALGYGQLQSDDFIRNYTLGKITQDCNFDILTIVRWINLAGTQIDQATYDLDPLLAHKTFLCACVYYCG